MATRHSYLELSQFLDLERRWMDTANEHELCHRICKTAALLLDTPTVAVVLGGPNGSHEVMAAEGDWAGRGPETSLPHSLVRKALSTATPQVKSIGDVSIGAFPFASAQGRPGCLEVHIDRPLFEGREVSFLRFLASLTGVMLTGGRPPSLPLEPESPPAAPRAEPLAGARRYVAMAVHDLRNPLNVLAGYTDLLADGSLGNLSPDQVRAVSAIERQINVLATTVDQLIDLDQICSGTFECQGMRFLMLDLLEELKASCFSDADNRIDWPHEEAAFEVFSDRRRVFSIVQNLVDNALRHGGEGRVLVESTRDNHHLVIRVSDRGIGLAPRAEASLMSWVQGIEPAEPVGGLGLCIVGSNIRLLGGQITVRRREDGGTIIEVQIPPSTPRDADAST